MIVKLNKNELTYIVGFIVSKLWSDNSLSLEDLYYILDGGVYKYKINRHTDRFKELKLEYCTSTKGTFNVLIKEDDCVLVNSGDGINSNYYFSSHPNISKETIRYFVNTFFIDEEYCYLHNLHSYDSEYQRADNIFTRFKDKFLVTDKVRLLDTKIRLVNLYTYRNTVFKNVETTKIVIRDCTLNEDISKQLEDKLENMSKDIVNIDKDISTLSYKHKELLSKIMREDIKNRKFT